MTRLLKAREAAEILGVTERTVYNWWREGRLPRCKLPGGGPRVPQGILEAWIKTNTNLCGLSLTGDVQTSGTSTGLTSEGARVVALHERQTS